MRSSFGAACAAILTTIFVAVLGNLAGVVELKDKLLGLGGQTATEKNIGPVISGLVAGIQRAWGQTNSSTEQLANFATNIGYNYFDPSRVIEGTINEFPFFSFLFADLHPHMIAIPFTLVLLAILINTLLGARNNPQPHPLETSEPTATDSEADRTTASPATQHTTSTTRTPDLPLAETNLTKRALHILENANITTISTLQAYAATQPLHTITGIGQKMESEINNFLLEYETSTTKETPAKSWIIPEAPGWLLQHSWGTILVVGFLLGLLFPTNAWDFPVYGGLAFLFFTTSNDSWLRSAWTATPKPSRQATILTGATTAALQAVLAGALGYLLYLPFHTNFAAPVKGIALNTDMTGTFLFSDPGAFFLIFGFFLTIIAIYLTTTLLKAIAQQAQETHMNILWLEIISIVLFALILAFRFSSLPAYLFLLLAALIATLIVKFEKTTVVIALLLAIMATCITLGTEFIFVRDHLDGGSMRRMNTVFKFYTQAWIIYAISAGILLPALLQAFRQFHAARRLLSGMLGVFFALMLIYPVFGTASRVANRFPQGPYPSPTLDSLAFMEHGIFSLHGGDKVVLAHELEAIEWMQEHIDGLPVILEAGAFVGFYREMGGRFAALTGFPTLSGTHENEQRDVQRRPDIARTIYETSSWEKANNLIAEYGIEYIIVGQLEKTAPISGYTPDLEKFEAQVGTTLDIAFENEGVLIYHVRS